MTYNMIRGSDDEKYRIVNFCHDILEAFTQKTTHQLDGTNADAGKSYEYNNHELGGLLFDKISSAKLYSKLTTIDSDGLYGANMLVSCGDNKRKHPHAFIINKEASAYTLYFLDPEFSIGKRDTFSPSATNGFCLKIDDCGKDYEIKIIRIATNAEDKALNKLHGIYQTLKNTDIKDIISQYCDKILMSCSYNSDDTFVGNHRDKNKPSLYTKAKFHSTSYLLAMIAKLIENDEIAPAIDANEKLLFKSKIGCKN